MEIQEEVEANPFFGSRLGVRYRLLLEAKKISYEFQIGSNLPDRRQSRGKRQLDYFVGSGSVGRGYASSIDGFLFLAPISYYSRSRRWDVPPGFEGYELLKKPRPIEPACLECHASQIQWIEGTQNGYTNPAFLEGGISCERCHGPGQKHVSKMSSGGPSGFPEIVNPIKLDPLRRDSVCAQCHLEGEVRIMRSARSLRTFRPGDLLSEHIVSFVWNSVSDSDTKVIGHVEQFWQSQCKKVSGDRLWCGTCHDPHSLPAVSQRTEYFRQKCLECHGRTRHTCSLDSNKRNKHSDDCIRCHMPKGEVSEARHSVFTDHSIPRDKSAVLRRQTSFKDRSLVSFWSNGEGITRELGLAYAKIGHRYEKDAFLERARHLLEEVVNKDANDATTLAELAYLYQTRGNQGRAEELYKRAISLDPALLEVASNLAGQMALQGRIKEAMQLWEKALKGNPGFTAARINLVLGHLQQGDIGLARQALEKALQFNPELLSDEPLLRSVGPARDGKN